MLRIPCPWCGPRDHSEFAYGGDATVRRPTPDAPLESWIDYVYFRDNPRGAHKEYWQHLHGCRRWIVVERDTLTHAIGGVFPAGTATAGGTEEEAAQ